MARRGFTLVELMVVVCIIGILATIAIPKYRDVEERADAAALIERVKTIQTAYVQAGEPRSTELNTGVSGTGDSLAPGVVPAPLQPHLPADAFRGEAGVEIDIGYSASARNITLHLRSDGSARPMRVLRHVRDGIEDPKKFLTRRSLMLTLNVASVP